MFYKGKYYKSMDKLTDVQFNTLYTQIKNDLSTYKNCLVYFNSDNAVVLPDNANEIDSTLNILKLNFSDFLKTEWCVYTLDSELNSELIIILTIGKEKGWIIRNNYNILETDSIKGFFEAFVSFETNKTINKTLFLKNTINYILNEIDAGTSDVDMILSSYIKQFYNIT